MLQRSKDDADGMAKWQNIMMSCIIAAAFIFLIPTLIVVVSGIDTTGYANAEDALFAAPKKTECIADSLVTSSTVTAGQGNCQAGYSEVVTDVLPGNFSSQISNLYQLAIWGVRIIIVIMAVASAGMLRVGPPVRAGRNTHG